MKDAEAQQIEAGSAIHLAFDELESVDLPFDVALTPWQRQGGFGCSEVSFEPCGEARQGCVFRGSDPRDQSRRLPLTDDAEEVLGQVRDLLDLGEVRYTCSSKSFAEGVGLSMSQTTFRGETRRGGRGK